jgi:hypothetical protein
MKENEILIQKASGERVPFSMDKLRASLERAGASAETIAEILPEILAMLHEGITTRTVYKRAYQMLKADSKPVAGRYKLKDALLELGPSGFPFEKFIGELFRLQGYKIEVGVTVDGACVTHEIDVHAIKGQEYIMIECKYHNKRAVNTDVKVPLYVHSRFQDIVQKMKDVLEDHNKHFQGWLITNTRFSDDAMQYGRCAGMHLMGWDYPQGNGLRELILQTGTHPITCMSTLSQAEKKELLEKDIVLCREIRNADRILHKMGVTSTRIQKIRLEAEKIASCAI